MVTKQDPFGMHSAALHQIPRALIEAWSPDKKREVVQQAARNSTDLVDHLVVGDYDLTLWHTRKMQGYDHAYLVSINNAQHNPLTAADQLGDFRATASRLPLRAIKDKLVDWVDSYGPVFIGSYIPSRNALYKKLVKKLLPSYTISQIHPGDNYEHGFRLDLTK